MLQCTIKKIIKKSPVRPIINFLPIEEVKKCFQVILKELEFEVFRWLSETKIRQDGQKQSQLLFFKVKKV